MLLVSDDLGPIGEIDPSIAYLLAACRGSRSIDEHVTVASGAGVAQHVSSIRQTLERLVAMGLLTPDDRLHRPASAPAPSSRLALTTVAIVTADRPALLDRCLASVASHCRTYGRRPRVVVVDGSRSDACRAENLQHVRTERGLESEYLGIVEARELRRRLVAAGIPESLAEFALTPGAVGANRNLALLATAGDDLMMLDDDVLVEPWTLPECSEHLAVGGHQEDCEVAWFATRDDALAATSPAAIDLLSVHGALLGRTLPALVAERQGQLDLGNACRHLLAALEQGEAPVVRATLMGIAGDSGTYCPDRQLFSAGAMRARLTADLTSYRCSMRSREVLRVATRYVLTHEAGGMSYAMGVSNRTPTPPFMPIGRNEDGVFSAMIGMLEPSSSLFAHLPYGIVHDSTRASVYGDAPMQSATETRLSELLLAVMRLTAASTFSISPATRRERIAAVLEDAAGLTRREFHRFIAHVLLRARSDELRATHADVCPPHFARALQQYADVLLENVTRPNFFVPVELQSASAEAALGETQEFLGRFSALLRGWPQMWAVARQCREQALQ
jgi:hypothetical protein